MPREESLQGTEAINSFKSSLRINDSQVPKKIEAVDVMGIY